MRKLTTSRGFGIIEALIGILILGLVVGGTVRTVQAIRAHESATEAYSQDQSQIKANADLVTGGNIVVSSGADGIKYMAAAGDASTPVKTKVIFSNNDGVGVVDELVQMENAKGWLAVGAVSRLEDKPETVVPDTSTLTLAVNPVQVNVGEGYSVSWTSTGMERVIVQELNEAGASVEFGNTLSNTGKTTSKSVAGTYTYKATGYYKGGTKAAVAQVKVIKPFAGDMDINVAEYATGPWSKAITVAPNVTTGSASYYVQFMHKGFETVQITRDGTQIATQTADNVWNSLAQSGTPGRTYVYRIVATDAGKTYTAEATVTVVSAVMWATNMSNVPITSIPVNEQFLVHYRYVNFPVETATFLRDFPNGASAGDGFILLSGSHAGTTNTYKQWGKAEGSQRIYASNVAGMMNFALVNGNTAAPQYASCRVNAIAPTTGRIWADPSSVKRGGSTTVYWTATGPVTVRRTTPSGQVTAGWGASNGNSQKPDGPLDELGSYKYELIANDTGGVISSCFVQVGQDVGTTQTVWIRANRVKSATVQNGQYYTIEWGSGNVSSAREDGPGLSETSVSGSKQIKATSNGTFTYTIRSTDGSNKTDSCTVTVSASNGSPWVSIAASATRVRVNEAYTISWQSGNCTSVAVSGPGLSSNKFSGTSGGISQGQTGTYTYTITGQPGNVTDSVSVIVEAAFGGGGGGGSVEIWSDKESPYHTVYQGDPFMVGWKSSGESGVTVEGWKPQNAGRVGDFNPAKNSLSGNQNMLTIKDDPAWPEGYYTFTITGNSGASDSCTVYVKRKTEGVAIYKSFQYGTGIPNVGGQDAAGRFIEKHLRGCLPEDGEWLTLPDTIRSHITHYSIQWPYPRVIGSTVTHNAQTKSGNIKWSTEWRLTRSADTYYFNYGQTSDGSDVYTICMVYVTIYGIVGYQSL